MANARQRAKDQRARRRAFHEARVEAAGTLIEKLEVAFGYFRAELVNTTGPARARQIVNRTITFLFEQADRIPRSSSPIPQKGRTR